MKKTDLNSLLQRYDARKGHYRHIFGDTKEIQRLRAIYNRPNIKSLDIKAEFPKNIILEIREIALSSTRTNGLTHDIMEEIKNNTAPAIQITPTSSDQLSQLHVDVSPISPAVPSASSRVLGKSKKSSKPEPSDIRLSPDKIDSVLPDKKSDLSIPSSLKVRTVPAAAAISISVEDKALLASKKNIAFLIEGQRSKMPSDEIKAGMALAEKNGGVIFDPISSFDVIHLSAALTGAEERDQRILVLCVYLAFAEEADSRSVIDKLIKPPFQRLVEKGYLKEMPTWVSSLNDLTFDSFAEEVLKNYFAGKPELFSIEYKKRWKQLLTLSNQISQKQFIEFLNSHPNLTTVYGLIGKLHLDMIDACGTVISRDDGYSHIRIRLEDRILNVHLFGGIHFEMAHYERMAKFAGESGLIVPSSPISSSAPQLVDLISKFSGLLSSSSSSHPFEYKRKHHQAPEHFSSLKADPRKLVKKTNDELAQQFDFWMKNYKHYGDPHNQELVDWLTCDGGANYVENYKQFVDLALIIAQKGYDTNPPPTELAFNEAISKEKTKTYSDGVSQESDEPTPCKLQ